MKVDVQAVGGAATVVYVVDFECCSCEVVVPAVDAGVCVAVEYAASGCGGYVLGGVCPDHHSPLCSLCLVPVVSWWPASRGLNLSWWIVGESGDKTCEND